MIPIPPYLQQHATFLKGNDTEVRFSISCTCGNPRLEVWQNCLSEAEQAEAAIFEKACKKLACGPWGATSIPDENGHLHHWKFLTPFGMKGLKKEIILPPAPIGSLIGVIQCKCPSAAKNLHSLTAGITAMMPFSIRPPRTLCSIYRSSVCFAEAVAWRSG